MAVEEPTEIEPTGKRPDAQHYYAATAAVGMVPLWTFFGDWFPAEPRIDAIPYLWRYSDVRPLLLDAAQVISTEEAERRVLVLENPALRGRRLATDSLYAGLQLIMPGETARSHRHSAAALRFIIEGRDTYTSVAGERCYMQPGDFITTPSWVWHDHGNESDQPTVWLDVLDVALVRFLGAGFSEQYSQLRFPETAPALDSYYRYGRNLLPAGFQRPPQASPVFTYPYAQARDTLERLRTHGPMDPHVGLKMEYTDPTSGGPAIPTISTFLQLVPAGFTTRPYASTAGAVVCVVAGSGRATIARGERAHTFEFGPGDLVSVPSWHDLQLHATTDAVLFSASDEAVQRKLGLWRERRS